MEFRVRDRHYLEEVEEKILAPYAVRSRGQNETRLYPEPEHDYRTNFQRDRDRIIHSRAFRRLKHKRQVFLVTTGDHYRTRLTHTIEVVQLSRTIARALGVNEDLTEAIALGHDLGHTPFGHIGEVALHKILHGSDTLDGQLEGKDYGGFKHNYQSVRVVDLLEKKYEFDGLNLTRVVREGILKHTRLNRHVIRYPNISEADLMLDLPNATSVEGQIVAICDEIAQRTHDLEDGLRAGFVRVQEVRQLPIVQLAEERLNFTQEPGQLDFTYSITLMKKLIHLLVTSVIEESLRNLEDYYRRKGHFYPFDERVVYFDREIDPLQQELDAFINRRIIHRPGIDWADSMSVYVIRGLFGAYLKRPKEMRSFPAHEFFSKYSHWPEDEFPHITETPEQEQFVRLVADYIAGMTDNFAMREFERLVGV